jgi:hypothetical protein
MPKTFENMTLAAETELDINDPSQLHYWMEELEVSERDLRMAVANVGTEVSELRVALGR